MNRFPESSSDGSPSAGAAGPVPFAEAFRVWVRVALLSFGGPAGQISVMHRILVDEKRWVSEDRFLHALNYCMLLPGPEAQQLAIYIGWLLHRARGGIVAGVLFVLPGFVSILALSLLFAGYKDLQAVEAIFYGLAPAVMAIVLHAVIRLGKKALKNSFMAALATAAFLGIFVFEIPYPWIIVGAGLIGLAGGRLRPDIFVVIKMHEADKTDSGDVMIPDRAAAHTQPAMGRALRVLGLCLSLWFVPLLLLRALHGEANIFVQEGFFFSKVAVVTFGGAYAVLAYVAQQAVEVHGWLLPGEMLHGLGMAETTPGPLIQVVQFVGFMGAFRAAEAGALSGLHPMFAGFLASLLVTWVTFVPCFLWILLGAPYIEKLRGNRSLTAALSAITAAVVGVILNLAVWFAAHTVFDELGETRSHGMRLLVPEWGTIDGMALAIAAGAFFAMFKFKAGMIRTLGGCVALGFVYRIAFG